MSHLNKKNFLARLDAPKEKKPRKGCYRCGWCNSKDHREKDCPYKAAGLRVTVGPDGVVEVEE